MNGQLQYMVRLSLALIVMTAWVTACSDHRLSNEDKKKSIALILKTKQSDYWGTIRMGAEVAAKEFDVNLIFSAPDDEEDIQGQIKLVEQAIRQSADAIVLAACDYKALVEVVEQAEKQRIPVITIESEVNSDKVRTFIGVNNYDTGTKAGEKLIELIGGQGEIALISFIQGAYNAEQREQGLLDVIADYPEVELVSKAYSYSDRGLAREITREIIEAHPRLAGIVALNATTSIGVASEIQSLGREGKVNVITIDYTPELLELLQEGVIQASIIQNSFSMGYLGVKHAVDAIYGRAIPERVDSNTKVIDLDNMFWSDNQKLLFPFVE